MTKKMIPPDLVAKNIRLMLDNDITYYRNYGVYWYFVKAFLKRYFDVAQMPILGNYEQPEVVARMPEYGNFEDAMHDALYFARLNQASNMNAATSIGPDDEPVTLFDADVGL